LITENALGVTQRRKIGGGGGSKQNKKKFGAFGGFR